MTLDLSKKSSVSHIFRLCLVYLALVSTVNATPWQDEKTIEKDQNQDSAPKIQLPENQKEPVFLFDQASGFRRSPKTAPDFQLFFDGTIKAVNGDQSIELTLSNDQLIEFLDFVVNKNRLYELTSEGIKNGMKQNGELPENQIADAATAKFTINLPKGKHSVDVYALFFAKSQHANVPGVSQLAAIELRCRQIVAKHVLGDKADGVIKFVNSEIKRKGLGIDPVSIKELRSANEQSNGRVQATFERAQPNPENTRSSTISINYFFEGKEGKSPVVRVYGLQRE